MTHKDFDVLLERRLGLTRSVLASKSAEYSSTEDKLHNFKAAASLQSITSLEALRGMMAKHIVSVMDMIKAGKRVSQAYLDEKVGDTLNYLILLEALMHDRGYVE